jgi:hypothetical protein
MGLIGVLPCGFVRVVFPLQLVLRYLPPLPHDHFDDNDKDVKDKWSRLGKEQHTHTGGNTHREEYAETVICHDGTLIPCLAAWWYGLRRSVSVMMTRQRAWWFLVAVRQQMFAAINDISVNPKYNPGGSLTWRQRAVNVMTVVGVWLFIVYVTKALVR